MAICNIFKQLTKETGTFLTFSQYAEDITKQHSVSGYKVVPSKFYACNINYAKFDNTTLPVLLQNKFENGCAFLKNTYPNWTPETSKTLFWNAISDLIIGNEILDNDEQPTGEYNSSIVYTGDINIQSYSNKDNIGYNEIYCYIPTDGERMRCQVKCITDELSDGRVYDARNTKTYVEGYTGVSIENYPQNYYYNEDFKVLVDTDINGKLDNTSEQRYDINTIVVLYSVFQKYNNEWNVLYEDIPMGVYFAGNFDNNKKLTNTITKYVTTSNGAGTAYGLRICTRFSATSNGRLINTDIVADDTGYVNMCQLMTAMNENLSKMLEVTRAAVDTRENYKELLSVLQNNKINVPYVKNINGTDFWFVNGKLVSRVDQGTSLAYGYLDEAVIQQRIDNLSDDDPTNDYTDIRDPLDLDAEEIPATELANALGMYEIMNPMPTE